MNSIFAQDLEKQTNPAIEWIKELIATPWFLSEEEMQEFNEIRTKKEESWYREIYERSLIKVYNDKGINKDQKAILIFGILDFDAETSLGKRAREQKENNAIVKIKRWQHEGVVKAKEELAKVEKRLAKTDERLAKAKEVDSTSKCNFDYSQI